MAAVLPTTEVIHGDVQDLSSLENGMEGVEVAYYLVHSMGGAGDFTEMDRRAAANFGQAASHAGVKKIIYLGGLGNSYETLSPHLQSRQEVGEILRNTASGVQVLEFRASIVLGSGSLSFELIRALTDRLPVMITPSWVRTESQPIAIEDLLHYLVKVLSIQVTGNPIFEIGGADRVTYGDLMHEYAKQRGLTRWMIPVPVLTPWLSSLWLALVTPLYARVGRKLIESASCPTIVHDPLAAKLFQIKPIGFREAIHKAIKEGTNPETRWMDSLSASGDARDWGGTRFGRRLIDAKMEWTPLSPEQVFKAVQKLGGQTGYYYGNWVWSLRGALDWLVGGVGKRRGRRDPYHLRVGDVVDFWRVEALEPNRRLRLAAELHLPGRAWLEFVVEPKNGGTWLKQTAYFDPAGALGLVYWYTLYPIHYFVFKGLLKGILKAAKA